jgi:hypothetical protein
VRADYIGHNHHSLFQFQVKFDVVDSVYFGVCAGDKSRASLHNKDLQW